MSANEQQAKFTDPLRGDEVPKVDRAVAIGEDLGFQETWWKFERAIWIFFLLILIADVLGVFGRGWLAKAKLNIPGSTLAVDYERVERASTPSIMRIRFLPGSEHDGAVHLFVNDKLLKELGTQRVAPEPERSVVGNGGVTYTFPVQGDGETEIQLALEPSFPGLHTFRLQVPGKQPVSARVAVVP